MIERRLDMQDAARAHWLAMVGDSGVPDMEAEDFGIDNDFDTAMEIGDILLLSNYHILPSAGGWNDQFEADANDIVTNLRGLAWARSMTKESNHEPTEGQETDSDPSVVKSSDWQNLL